MLAKKILRQAVESMPAGLALRAAEALRRSRSGQLTVLTYHRVLAPAAFAAHAAYLAARHHVVGADAVLAALAGERALPPGAVLITFDDGYRDFAEVAWPALQRHGLPAVLFVATGFTDRPDRVFWWDQLRAAIENAAENAAVAEVDTPVGRLPLATAAQRGAAFARLRSHLKRIPDADVEATVADVCARLGAPPVRNEALGWDDLRRLAREGVALAPHTRLHPLLDRVDLDRARAEIAGSRDDLERQVGTPWAMFAYPGGHYTPEVVGLVRELGFRAAFTTVRGVNDLRRADPLRLRRINVGWRAGLGVLRLHMLEAGGARYRMRRTPDADAP